MRIVYIAHALSGDWEGNCADASGPTPAAALNALVEKLEAMG